MAVEQGIGNVVNLRPGRGHQDYTALACRRFAAMCQTSGLSRAEVAARLTAAIGSRVTPQLVTQWETQFAPPGSAMLAVEDLVRASGGELPVAALGLLDQVLPVFPVSVLAGPWVTCYQFLQHGKTPRCHADIAHVTAVSERAVRAVNHPPEPRSEGRASGFRNEIEAQLVGRHLVGAWKNTSDTRYYGSVQLAVLPGEVAMEGTFTGVASDVEVSAGRWRWVRLATDEVAGRTVLRDPRQIFDLVMNRSPYDALLALDDIREDAQ